MGKRVIRLGDPTSHGGQVVSVASNYNMFGKNVATVGDKATCPMKDHGGIVTIIEGDPTWSWEGRAIALEGHKCSCGCSLISTLPNVTRSYDSDGAGNSKGGAHGDSHVADSHQPEEQYDEQVKLEHELVEGLPYFIETSSGKTFSGRVSADFHLERIVTESMGSYTVYWGDDALVKAHQ